MSTDLCVYIYAMRNRLLRFQKKYKILLNFSYVRTTIFICLLLSIFTIIYITVYSSTDDLLKATALKHIKQLKLINSKVFDSKKFGLINNENDRIKKENGFRMHAFNTLVSERIGIYRDIPDTRPELCHNQTNSLVANQYKLSVIICFYNEDFITLLRTIYSLLYRTSPELLFEIILVDDHSDNLIEEKLLIHKNSMNNSSIHTGWFKNKVHYYRIPERSGLIRARLYGANMARGNVLFFIDSHCEVNENWLPPLLDRIAANRKSIVCPIIDLIDSDTFQYTSSPFVKGGFNWGLHFKWDSVPSTDIVTKEDFIKPIKTPTMAGGLFAVERNYFYEIGSYDKGMDIWGGENIEISFRVWMCGGQIEIIPCSRVGHVFRRRRPYSSPENLDTLAYNSLRVAHVWMDEYKDKFLSSRSDLKTMSYGNIDERLQLRKKLNCKNFTWYLRNIYPDLLLNNLETDTKHKNDNNKQIFPHKPPKTIKKFLLQSYGSNLCLEAESEMTYKKSKLHLAKCSQNIRKQIWKETAIHDFRLSPKSCLDTSQQKQIVRLSKCHEMGGTQQWTYNSMKNTTFYNVGSGMCLGVESVPKMDTKMDEVSLLLTITYCDNSSQLEQKKFFNRWNLLMI